MPMGRQLTGRRRPETLSARSFKSRLTGVDPRAWMPAYLLRCRLAWIAKLVAVEKAEGMVKCKVKYKSPDPLIPDIIDAHFGDNLSASEIKRIVAYKLQSLNACDSAFDSFTAANLKPGDTITPADLNADPLAPVK